jgi:glycerol dehydrogenase
MKLVYASTGRYTQGPGVLDELLSELDYLGLDGSILIISGPTVHTMLGDRLAEQCSQAGRGMHYECFNGECTSDEIERLTNLARENNSGILMGAGGGKVLDTARAVAAAVDRPFVSCPTLASTDSPCSALAIVYDEDGVYQGFRSFGRNPALTLVDTTLILHSPDRYFVAGMGDGLSTFYEARACIKGNRVNLRGGHATIAATQIAEACCKTLLADGRQALADKQSGTPSDAFERVVEANTLLSGIGFESIGVAAAHGLHNAMTVAPCTHRYLHGEKVSFGTMMLLVLEDDPFSEYEQAARFSMAVGLPITLAEVGLDHEDTDTLQKIAERAVRSDEVTNNEPFPVTSDAVLAAMLEADRRGRSILETPHP